MSRIGAIAALVAAIAPMPVAAAAAPDWVLIGTSGSNADYYIDRASVKIDGDVRTFAELTAPRSVKMQMVQHERVDCAKMTLLALDTSIDGAAARPTGDTEPKAVINGSLGWAIATTACSLPAP